MKQGFDDGLFREGSGTLADVNIDPGAATDEDTDDDDEWDDEDGEADPLDDDPLRDDTDGRRAS